MGYNSLSTCSTSDIVVVSVIGGGKPPLPEPNSEVSKLYRSLSAV